MFPVKWTNLLHLKLRPDFNNLFVHERSGNSLPLQKGNLVGKNYIEQGSSTYQFSWNRFCINDNMDGTASIKLQTEDS